VAGPLLLSTISLIAAIAHGQSADSDQLRAALIAAQTAKTVAWITGGLALLGTLVGAAATLRAARVKQRAEQLEKGIQKSGSLLARELIDRFGVKVRSVSVLVEILNDQGDAAITRTIRGFEIVQDITISAIPVKTKIAAPQGKLLNTLDVEATVDVEAKAQGGAPYPKDVTPVQIELTDNDRSLSAMLEVAGLLSRFDPPLDLVYRLQVKAGYVLSADALKTAYPQGFRYEYHASATDLPTGALVIEIRFPAGYRAEPFAGVFLGGTETMHNAELNRIQGGLERLPHGARLRVEGPVLGFSYLIYWTAEAP
jgi:hypothetical protein